MRLQDKVNQMVVDELSVNPRILSTNAVIKFVFLRTGGCFGKSEHGKVKQVETGVWELVK